MDEEYSRPGIEDCADKLDRVIALLESIDGQLKTFASQRQRRNARALAARFITLPDDSAMSHQRKAC